MIPFATLLFDRLTKDWWVHKQQEYWAMSITDPTPARFHYPTWEELIGTINDQFRDPAVEEVHEKKMFDLCMSNGPATTYFQELEKEATQARVPGSYITFIANVGENIPQTYPEWKAQIIIMYEERQKKWVFDQATSTNCDSCPPQKGQGHTATSNNKAGGTTSSLPGKPTSSGPPWEPGMGRWQPVKTTTYHRAGELIDIGKLCMEGRCFWCHKRGHLGKDCLKKWDYKDICLVVVTEQEKTETKVEEIKEMAV
ncbi:hypothetical protein ARMSODRAFT_1017817 [Armillaria solidipes]|uniref:CCHC-type domain-containing protein n=1 Tax=Armillaria solidipes TaxID=1076256 RepID=A0A2H3BJI0_9AGAR|nr:hypothetical protein ARMSODRAFT_1017817 [Armillaria solidipes]